MRRQNARKQAPPTFGVLQGIEAEKVKGLLEGAESSRRDHKRVHLTPHLMAGEVEVRGDTILIGVGVD